MAIDPDRLHSLAALILAVTVGACDEQAEMRVTLQPDFRYPEVTLEVEDRDGTRVFDRSDLETEPDGSSGPALSTIGTLSTGSFQVAESGSLRVKLRVEDGSLTVADAAVQLGAREDFRWTVRAAYLVEDPTEDCLGCLGVRAFPIAEEARLAPAESLWVWWSGRREGSDAVF